MNNHYTFIVTSSLNSPFGVYSLEQRQSQTIETILSIKKHVKNACIVFIDTEMPPLTVQQKQLISKLVDYYIEHVPSIFEKIIEKKFASTFKTVGEYCLYDLAFDYIIKNNLVGRRIFKISGRYRLCNSFDIAAYQNPVFDEKYVFRNNTMYIVSETGDSWSKEVLETRLWSMCHSQLTDFHSRLPEFLLYSVNNIQGIEMTFWNLLDKDKVFTIPQIHVEGNIATNGAFVSD